MTFAKSSKSVQSWQTALMAMQMLSCLPLARVACFHDCCQGWTTGLPCEWLNSQLKWLLFCISPLNIYLLEISLGLWWDQLDKPGGHFAYLIKEVFQWNLTSCLPLNSVLSIDASENSFCPLWQSRSGILAMTLCKGHKNNDLKTEGRVRWGRCGCFAQIADVSEFCPQSA